MARWPHLQRRETTYYFRRRVPADLQAQFGKREWVFSLGTSSPEQARRLCRAKSFEIDEMIARAELLGNDRPPEASRILTADDVEPLVAGYVAEQLALDLIARQTLRTPYAKKMAATVDDDVNERGEDLARGRFQKVSELSDELLARSGFIAPSDDEVRSKLSWSLLAARREVAEALQARSKGRHTPTPTLPSQTASHRPTGRTVGDLIKAYTTVKALAHGEDWVSKRYGHLFRALTELLGPQTALADVNRESCRQIRRLLEQTPTHASKRYPGKSLVDAAKLSALAGTPAISATTVNSYLSALSAMLSWAVAESWIPTNPAAGLVGAAPAAVNRRGFREPELQKIFDDLRSDEFRPWQFWLPALALYTGARANELCQLQVGDIVTQDDGLWLRISIYDADGRRVPWKHLKTPTSERKIPIHPALIGAGIGSLVTTSANREHRLFPELTGQPGNYSRKLSRWFAHRLDEVGLLEPSLVFHSFRHTFKTACLEAGLADSTIRALGGWARADIAEGYGDRSPETVMRRAISRLTYGKFELPKPS